MKIWVDEIMSVFGNMTDYGAGWSVHTWTLKRSLCVVVRSDDASALVYGLALLLQVDPASPTMLATGLGKYQVLKPENT